jgi:NAD(P)-dependent dehydrogenase (short-subunit alcohol dehydrogenase family)
VETSRSKISLAGAVIAGTGIAVGLSRRRPMGLTGKVAFITGGSRGLGLQLAREFARAGCKIAICARDDDELARAAADLRSHDTEVFTIPCDVANRGQMEQAIADATSHFGRIDVLVNNAGIIQAGPIEAMTVADFEQAMGVMFWGTLYATLAVLPQMRSRRAGAIVNITSVGGKIAMPHLLPYDAAKFAATGFSEGLRAEVARDGITVTTIAPGLLRTGGHRNALFKGNKEAEFSWFSLGDTLPFAALDVEQAAREIVAAARRGQAERILSLPASGAARFHGLFPALTTDILGLVNRFLPRADGRTGPAEPGVAVLNRTPDLVRRTVEWGEGNVISNQHQPETEIASVPE